MPGHFFSLEEHIVTVEVLGLPQSNHKAVGPWKRGAELGSCKAHNKLSLMYMIGEGVEQDMEKSIHHLKIAAIGGHERARHYLGKIEGMNGNMDRAMKHFIIAAKSGFGDSLKEVGDGYKAGHVTKDEYAATSIVFNHWTC